MVHRRFKKFKNKRWNMVVTSLPVGRVLEAGERMEEDSFSRLEENKRVNSNVPMEPVLNVNPRSKRITLRVSNNGDKGGVPNKVNDRNS